jgi:hypothetical protein
MPTIPKTTALNASSVDILNAIRNSATANYRNYVPPANPAQANVREIGAVIMQYPALQNEFLTALINRIGLVLITSKMYDNPIAMFKRGMLEFGESIEEIFVNIAKPFQYDPAVAESKVFAREIPDVRAAFHFLNYQKYYKVTIQNEQLRQAFLSWDGVTDLIAKIVDSMYSGAAYDEFLTMKYLLAKHILNGQMYPVQISSVTAANMKAIASSVKGVSNRMEFPSTNYNLAGVLNHTNKDNQYLIVNADFDALMDVEVLASAFNMDKAEFMGHRVMIDSFGSLDTERLDALFADDPNYTTPTAAQLAALDAVAGVVVDRDWFMIFDNLQNFTEQYNGEGLYWNYWYHVWKTFSVSPFANAAVFVPGAPGITSVSLSPAATTISAGQTVTLTATVVTTNFASQAVNYTVTAVDSNSAALTDAEVAAAISISPLGVCEISPDADSGTVFTVTATSVVDSTAKDTATITVA